MVLATEPSLQPVFRSLMHFVLIFAHGKDPKVRIQFCMFVEKTVLSSLSNLVVGIKNHLIPMRVPMRSKSAWPRARLLKTTKTHQQSPHTSCFPVAVRDHCNQAQLIEDSLFWFTVPGR